MTTFALFYKPIDITAIAAWATNQNITAQERQYANRLWNGGLSNWSVAPQALQTPAEACVISPTPYSGQDPDVVNIPQGDGTFWICDPTIKRLVISGSQVSKQLTIDWLRQLGNKYPDAIYMLAIADDILQTAIEPYTG
jgi:hypothetical protein